MDFLSRQLITGASSSRSRLVCFGKAENRVAQPDLWALRNTLRDRPSGRRFYPLCSDDPCLPHGLQPVLSRRCRGFCLKRHRNEGCKPRCTAHCTMPIWEDAGREERASSPDESFPLVGECWVGQPSRQMVSSVYPEGASVCRASKPSDRARQTACNAFLGRCLHRVLP